MIARVLAVLALKDRAKVAVDKVTEAAAAVAIRTAIMLVAVLFLLVGVIYVTIALFLFLETVLEPWQAMGIVGGAVIVVGAIIFMLGAGSRRRNVEHHDHGRASSQLNASAGRRRRSPTSNNADSASLAALAARGGEAGVALHERLRRNPEFAAAVAFGAGLLIGRSPAARRALLAVVSAVLGAKDDKD